MRNTQGTRSCTVALLVLLALPMPSLLCAEEGLTLKDVMQGLNTSMQDVTYGILMNDYDQISKSAREIAVHPTPDPALLKKVVAHLGSDMPQFKGFDKQVHDSALAMEQAAMARDQEALLEHHNQILRGCVGCHESFRDSVAAMLNN